MVAENQQYLTRRTETVWVNDTVSVRITERRRGACYFYSFIVNGWCAANGVAKSREACIRRAKKFHPDPDLLRKAPPEGNS